MFNAPIGGMAGAMGLGPRCSYIQETYQVEMFPF